MDCVEMKREAQKQLLEEWERRREEFPSFAEFLHAVSNESPWVREFRDRVSKAHAHAK